jgi:hypothetical protein
MRSTLLAILLAGCALAQPALTLIQDTLYQADGTKFQGMATISWSSFQASDLSNIAANSVRVPIVNGALRVRLVPTTNAAVAASYSVVYNSNKVQFGETWAVPPSIAQLRVQDVRISTSALISAESTPLIPISGVSGLQSELLLRPMAGTSFAVSRTAVINATGGIDGAAGNAGDCVHVDGTSGTCGTGGSSALTFVDAETPGGTVDGSNVTFTLSLAPNPAGSLLIFLNGLLMRTGVDFTLSGQVVTFVAGAPQPGDILQCSYRAAS